MPNVIERALDGEVVLLPQYLQQLNLFDQLQNVFLNSIKLECGDRVHAQVARKGLEQFHNLIPTEQIINIYKRIESELYKTLPEVMIKIALSVDIPHPFYVHKNAYARIMVPVDQLDDSFKYRAGRLYPYDGVHQDSYRTIDRVINFWMAIGHVKEENGIEIYPDMWGQDLPQEGFNFNIEGLGEPVRYELNPGDILVFHSRHIHTTVLNYTDQTRVALTSRVCFSVPEGDPEWIKCKQNMLGT